MADAGSKSRPQEEARPAEALQEPEPDKEPAAASAKGVEEDDEDDSKETCGFCKFMKGGGCRQQFNAWSKCVDKEREAGGDFTSECHEKTMLLRECMMQHRDYYAPLLEEEEAMMREQEEAELAAKQAEMQAQQQAQQQQQQQQEAAAPTERGQPTVGAIAAGKEN